MRNASLHNVIYFFNLDHIFAFMLLKVHRGCFYVGPVDPESSHVPDLQLQTEQNQQLEAMAMSQLDVVPVVS